ncbi:TPR repeat region-containing protein [Nocardiopsis dassonvillei]|uniref:TPR repeat region-containing protein n=1 Tax=Nocardiopsis dassonvillei TaxID=2014 RepID=UPI00362827BB
MATFDLTFQPRTTTANPAAIRARMEDLDILQARLLGRADDLTGQFGSTATQFTDLVGWNIKGLSEEDYQYWKDAGVAITYAASKIEQWAQYVEEFKDEREAQNTEWFDFRTKKEGEIPADFQGQTITATHPERGGLFGISDASKCRDIYDEVAAKLTELQERERTNYQKFEEHAEDVAEDLREGPTKANVQELIDAGINSWAFYNLDPNRYTMLVDGRELTEENAEEWAEELSSYWSGDKPLDERYHELMLMMSMIGSNAMQAQQGGTGYRSEEIDFLREFYDALEGEDPNSMGVLGVPAQMEGDHLTDEEREHALGVLGDGLLTLSDENLGGSYEYLPRSVRRTAEGPQFYEHGEGEVPYSWVLYQGDVRALSDFFRHTNEDLQGGYELSVNLSMSSGTYTHHIGDSDLIPPEELAPLLDVATRNEDANYYVITGEHPGDDPYADHPALGTDSSGQGVDYADLGVDYTNEERTNVIEGLFTHEWEDGGAAVRGLTDWISEDAASPEDRVPEDENSEIRPELSAEEQRSAEALAALVRHMENPEFSEAMFATGHEVTGDDGVTWRDVAAGHLNPELADSWSDIFVSYMDVFASTEGVGESESSEGHDTRWDDDQNRVYLSPEGRMNFTEFIMGDVDAAHKTYGEVVQYGAESMAEFATDNGPRSHEGSSSYGSLLGLVDVTLNSESERRSNDNTEAVAHANKVRNLVVDTAGGFAGDRNAPGLVVEIAKFLAKEALEVSDNPPDPKMESPREWMAEEDMNHLAISAMAANDPEIMDALEALHPGAVLGEGADRYIPLDPAEWDVNGESQDTVRGNLYDHVDELPWVDGEGSTKSAVDNYLLNMGISWGKWQTSAS